MSKQIAYQASAKGCHTTAETPRKAAEKFFDMFPSKRKCNVTQGETDGMFFIMKISVDVHQYTLANRWKDITKKTIDTLPADADVLSQNMQ